MILTEFSSTTSARNPAWEPKEFEVSCTLNVRCATLKEANAFSAAYAAFVESVSSSVQDAEVVPAPAPAAQEQAPEPVAPAPQADDVVVYATPAAPMAFNMYVPDPVVHIENNTAPVVAPEPAPVAEEAPKQKRTRKKAEPVPVEAPQEAAKPPVASLFSEAVVALREQADEEEQADLFAAPAAKVAVGTVKVGEHSFACTYSQVGVYTSCRVSIPQALADKLGVDAKQFECTADSKKEAAQLVAEELQDYMEVQSWKKAKVAPAPEPAAEPEPEPEPEPAPAPAPVAEDNPFIPVEVLRMMLDTRKITDTTVRSEVLAMWCKHLYHVIGIKDGDAILAHMYKHQATLTTFEKKPMGSSVPRLVHTLVEGYEKPVPQKRTSFKAEAPEAVTEVPGDEIDEDDVPY